ncbi:FtsQ-type POTRA domain-containing protein [Frigoribacterium sp. VKM Ac-2836]|uniref:FtsQ-type POTRA domain-containing protein n=1 Tax=Frigoribacterium sp. VKM Ac-2836 TaxID=2739014 RepID=UPI001566A486|nr:FtsQ-type POTRA domain-containing protein [Frigoribacterium sp. VKM Ac-2836]NRD26124.1 FtsQ-type POTRA domain-containing protein [Frigoribacterium sp. VKM Ac-2836]
MKRPDGFDEPSAAEDAPAAQPRRRRGRDADTTGPVPVVGGPRSSGERNGATRAARGDDPSGASTSAFSLKDRLATVAGGRSPWRDRSAKAVPTDPAGSTAAKASGSVPPRIDAPDGTAAEAKERAVAARRQARRASSERRRVERVEVRRFTRRSRHRRATLVSLGAVVLLLVASVAVAVFSPLLSLQTIRVEGTQRVDASAVQTALDGQLGTPLALIDFDEVTRELAAFPLIASYVTETAPPHTLVVRVQERQPVATVAAGDGFELVDPAGVVVQSLDARQEGVPLVDVGGAALDGPAYRSVAEVLLALPVTLRSTVDTVTASTADDVTLQLTSGERVVWGSADESAKKAQVLAGLIADQARRDPGASVEYDVSAPDNGIIRTR